MRGFSDETLQYLQGRLKGGCLLEGQFDSGCSSALSSFEAWVAFVDDVQLSFSAYDLAVSVAVFECFEGGADFHGCMLGEAFGSCQALFAETCLFQVVKTQDDQA